MSKIKLFFLNLLYREDGASGIEYALMASLVVVAIATLVPGIRTQITAIFTSIGSALTP